MAITEVNVQKLVDYVQESERLRAELERVQKQAAEIQGIIQRLYEHWTLGIPVKTQAVMEEIKHSLSTDAGAGYVRLEDVKPLVEDVKAKEGSARVALAHFTKLKCDSQSVDCCVRCNVVALANWTLNAIAHAKAKGLL